MFENLSERLERSFKILKGEGKITEINVAETLKDVRRALLDADVNYKVAKSFTDTVKQKALGMNVLTSIKPGQLMVKLVHDELAELMGGNAKELQFENRPAIILMAGLNGAGKTTFSGKLALMLKNQKRKPLLAACDTFRAAAIDQLETWAERSGAEFVKHQEGSDPAAVAFDACSAAVARGCDVVLIDTAGRLHNKDYLMEELKKIVRVIKKVSPEMPQDMWLVIDGNTGQNTINQTKIFNQSFPLTGLVVTKLDGTARGGAVLSIASSLQIPIRWIGMGERIDQLVPFSKAEYVEGLFENALEDRQ